MNKLEELLEKDIVKYDEDMKKHTSFKVGGKAKYYVEISNLKDLETVVNYAKENNIRVLVIGNGTNIIVRDEGVDAIVLRYINDDIEIIENKSEYIIKVASGMLNGKLGAIMLDREIAGFEFCSGIPGTIGGALFMNAGAHGSEIKDIVEEVKFIDFNTFKIYTKTKEECEFEYRKSIFQKMENILILECTLRLSKGQKCEIFDKMMEYKNKRISTQPVNYPSAGSTFKRGNDFITAKLIDECGLKGTRIGDAMVSEKHAGFIVNVGNAKASDILELIEYVKKKVYEKYHVNIETEVRILE